MVLLNLKTKLKNSVVMNTRVNNKKLVVCNGCQYFYVTYKKERPWLIHSTDAT